ncbi:MobV family relaxase [Burkholderia paludis]|uniref:MobV family relaxase n=1 Tax=Burkholderia paludis TaxID=1506587 RepID=UPI000946ED55|nr:MobV family relaxase [Burkholderia paludis]
MSHPVIIRTAKLASLAAVTASGRHTWRESVTPNADPARTGTNSDWRLVRSADELADAVMRRVGLATEKAKEPVLCIEYLVTANADAFAERGGKVDSDAYFRDALVWLEKRHGAENVIAVNIQRDETAPHMVAYVVPLVNIAARTRRRSVIAGTNADGTKRRETREFGQVAGVRLSAAHYQGTPAKLRAMQSDFAASVGAHHGLARGVEGSCADHQTIRRWYGEQAARDARLAAAEQRAERLLRGVTVLSRRVAEKAPALARELGLAESPRRHERSIARD